MKTKSTSELRSENARNEARDSHGRFTSEHSGSSKSKSSQSGHDGRGSNAKNEPRDAQGRFTKEKK